MVVLFLLEMRRQLNMWDYLQVEILVVLQNEHSFSRRSAPDVDPLLYEYSLSTKELASHLNNCAPLYSNSSVARHSLASTVEHPPRRELLSEPLLQNPNLGASLHRQFHQSEACSLAQKLQKPIDDDKYDDTDDCSSCQASTVSAAPSIQFNRKVYYLFPCITDFVTYSQKSIEARELELMLRLTWPEFYPARKKIWRPRDQVQEG